MTNITFRAASSLTALAVAIGVPMTAQAQSPSQPRAGAAAPAQEREFSIAAQDASSGIRTFAQQAGIQVTVAGRDTQGRRVSAVRGRLDVRTALEQLIAGTDLVIRSFDGRSAILASDVQVADAGEAILVTGSRIARTGLDSVMPISVTDMDDAFDLGITNVYEALQRDPVLSAGGSLYSTGSGRDAGISSLDLRNLGAQRTLTVIDGRRRVASSVGTAAVDVGTIPIGMIDRIEVVTGGAAAIYGADAVTGAVNIITKRNVDGLNVRATAGISEEGDAEEYLISASAGGTFINERGTFSIGGTYSSISSLDYLERYASNDIPGFRPNPANTGPDDGIPDNLIFNFNSQPILSFEPNFYFGGETYILTGESLTQYDCGIRRTTGELQVCSNNSGARGYYDTHRLRGSNDSLSVMGRYDYEIADNVTYGGYFTYASQQYQGLGAYPVRDDSRNIWFKGAGGAVAYLDNPYLPEAMRSFMLDNGLTSIATSRTYGHFPWHEFNHDRENFTLGQTLGGGLGGFDWNLFYQYGRTRDDVVESGVPISDHWVAARDVIADPVTGLPVCRDEVLRASGCVPHNIFSMDAPSDALLAYVMDDRNEEIVNIQHVFGVDISGDLLALPYGDLSFLVGAEHRIEKLQTTDDPLALNGDLIHTGNGASTHTQYDVRQDVTEFYGEVIVPVLAGLPFAERLDIEGAYRYSDYSTVGSTHTWKAGASWSPVPGMTLRGARSRSVRTPNFGELYSPQNVSLTSGVTDPCQVGNYNLSPTRAANCAALGISSPLAVYADGFTITTGGSPDLDPEVSNSLTLGLVFEPAFLPGLALTVDYWDIDIESVISRFGYTTIVNLCVDMPSIDNVPCSQVTRDPASGRITDVQATTTNVGRLYANGIDFGANYRLPLAGGQLGMTFKGSWLMEQVTETTPGIPAGDVRYDGNWANPSFRANLLAKYEIGDFAVHFNTRFRGASTYSLTAVGTELYSDNDVPAIVTNDISVQYAFGRGYELGLGVRNLTDQKPPQMPSTWFDGNYYDVVGRYFFATAKVKL